MIRAGLVELERKAVVRIHGSRLECSGVADDGVHVIVLVGPSHRGPGLDGERCGLNLKSLTTTLLESGVSATEGIEAPMPHSDTMLTAVSSSRLRFRIM